MFVSAGMEGERPARLNRGEADRDTYRRSAAPRKKRTNSQSLAKKKKRSCLVALLTTFSSLTAGADKKAEAGAGAATEFQFVSIDFCFQA